MLYYNIFFSDFIILPGFIDFAPDQVVSKFYWNLKLIKSKYFFFLKGFVKSSNKEDHFKSSLSFFTYGYSH